MKQTLSLVALLAALSFAPEVLAQKTLSKEQKTLASTLFEEGEQHYKLQEYDKAIEKYKEAYRISNSPVLLFNIGQCYRQIGKLEEARRSYQTFIEEDPKTPYRKDVEQIIRSLTQEIDKKRETDTIVLSVEEQPTSQPTKPNKPPVYIAALQPKVPVEVKRPPLKLLYGGIAGGTGLGLVLGGLSLLKARQAKQLQADATGDLTESLASYDTAKTLALGADIMFLAAIGSVGALIQWYPKGKKKERVVLRNLLSPTQINLSISYEN